MRILLIAGAAGLAAFALPTLAQMAGGPAAEWGRAVTRSQAEEKARAEFALADIDKDGFVTRDEIRTAAEARVAEHRNTAFDRIDTDRSGTISRAEFAARPAIPDITLRRFDGAAPDKAHDGKPGLRIMTMRRGPDGGAMLMMADADRDGRVSQAEAVDGTLKLFDRTDADHDGSVTPQERGAAMQAWGAKMRDWGAKMHHGTMGDMPPAPPPPPAG